MRKQPSPAQSGVRGSVVEGIKQARRPGRKNGRAWRGAPSYSHRAQTNSCFIWLNKPMNVGGCPIGVVKLGAKARRAPRCCVPEIIQRVQDRVSVIDGYLVLRVISGEALCHCDNRA